MEKFFAFPCAFLLFCFLWANIVPAAEINVSAASSLANAFEELKNAFEKENPGEKLHLNFAGSDLLLKQMEAGAPADVFASADPSTMDKAVAAKVVDPATRRNFALNSLVLIVPHGAKKPSSLEDLRAMERVAIGNPDSVPAGRYARQALTSAGLWKELEKKYIPGENVRQALNYVALGEVDAGFVYATDARQMADRIDVAIVTPGHDPVLYPVAAANTGNNYRGGKAFANFLLSTKGREVLAKYGFGTPAQEK